jgi:two-component system, OmpR family, response regulator VanR
MVQLAASERMRVLTYDIAVLDRDIPGPSGDEIANRVVASGSDVPILLLSASDRLDDKRRRRPRRAPLAGLG